MSYRKICILAVMAVGLASGLAHAQTRLGTLPGVSAQPGLNNRPDYDNIYAADRIDENARREVLPLHEAAIAALQAKDYQAAERVLDDLVSRKPTTVDSNFLMGLAKIGLEKWDEARTYLEVAVAKEPKRPEPKTRLGLAYAKLDSADAARRQRAELANLDSVCKKACDDATWIADGLVLLDQALGAPAAPVLIASAPAASPSPTSPAAIATTTNFDPAMYNLVSFTDTADLYDLLTRDGRCAPKKLADPRQPCALILYRPDDGSTGGFSANFKPVFRVDSRTSIWAIHNKELQKVRIENLYFDIQDIIGQKQASYRSVALIGNAENKANCNKGLTCLSSLVAEDMFSMYGKMPDSVVQVIWGAGMKDPGTVRVR